MIKITSTADFDFDVPAVEIISSEKTLQKRGSCRPLLKFEKTANQTDVHVIALGSYEGYGPNRNYDAFSEKDCKGNHDTFVKAGRAIHRHHKNKPSDPKYGNIKASAYNEPMRRVELVIGLDNDKCQDILGELEKNGSFGVSMASRQAWDCCSICGHKARDEKSRCSHIPSQLGEMTKEGKLCYMDNPNPKWFELSYVRRPADRIGHSLAKLAALSEFQPLLPKDYLTVYPGFTDSELVAEITLSKQATVKRELIQKLSALEKRMEGIAKSTSKDSQEVYSKENAKKIKGEKINDKDIDELRKHEPKKVFKATADKGVIFSPENFFKYLFGDRISEEAVESAKSHLPSIYSKTKDSKEEGEMVNDEKFAPGLDGLPAELKSLVSKLMDSQSLNPDKAHCRVLRITMIVGKKPESELSKKSCDNSILGEKLAQVYASYKLAALTHLQEHGLLDEELLWNSVLQNYA